MADLFNEMLQKSLELVAIDSVQSTPCDISPFGEGVGRCIETTLSIAKNMGFKIHNEAGYYGTATIGEGEEFGILGHLDVVPYNKEDWSANPLGEIKDGWIYGRGIMDDKAPMLCCLYAVKQLLDEGFKLNKKIKFIFGGNEESGWKCIERYNQVETMPYTGISPDADFPVINCEKGILNIKATLPIPYRLLSIKGGSRPNVVIDNIEAIIDGVLNKSNDKNISSIIKDGKTYITATGQPAHGSTPEKGDNAFWHLLNYLSKEIGTEYTTLLHKLCSHVGEGMNIAFKDSQSGKLSCNIGLVYIENNELCIVFDIRYPISISKELIVKNISSALNTNATILHVSEPLYVDKNDPLVVKLLDAYKKVTGKREEPIAIGGGTYARALKHGVAFGPMFPNQESTIHSIDERVKISDLRKAYDVYYEALKSLCFE